MASEDADAGQPGDGAGEMPEMRKISDARTLRALSHPVRIALLEALLLGGPMTSTEAGERIGESPTTCSFHMRQLAKYGFVVEAGEHRGRSKPWRLTSIGMFFTPGGDPEAEVASGVALHLFRERQFARYRLWRETTAAYPAEWREAASDIEYVFHLTAGELKQLNREVAEVLMRWYRLEGRLQDPAKRPPGSVPVETLLLSYPTMPPDGGQSAPHEGG